MSTARLGAAAAAALLASFAAIPAGANFAVTKTADTNDGVCDADCSLREAVIAANASPGADTITVPAGTYRLGIAGAGEELAATGDLDITGPTTIQGAGAGVTVIDGAGVDRVFDVHSCGGCSVAIRDLSVTGGSVSGLGGGGIAAYAVGTHLTLSRVHVVGNRATGASDEGGGVLVGNTADVQIFESEISENSAAFGGGLRVGSNSTASMVFSSTIGNNTASISGGGVDGSEGALSLFGTTISGNAAGSGGGGVMAGYELEIQTCTVSGNSASSGGAIGSYNPSDSSYVQFTTVFGNSGLNAIETRGSLQLIGTIVYDTAPPVECHVIPSGSLVSNGDNLVRDGSCGSGAGDLSGVDPMLEPLSWNGSIVRSYYPEVGSPVINAGLASGCFTEHGEQVLTDQRGETRPFAGDGVGRCDIGSVEFVPEPDAAPLAVLAAAPLLGRAWRRRTASARS